MFWHDILVISLNIPTPTGRSFSRLSGEYKFVISLKVIGLGVSRGDRYRVIIIHNNVPRSNTSSLPGPACTADDFMSWSIRDELKSTECVLGIDTQFERKKGTAHCYIGSDYKRTVSELSCPCQASDFEW